MRLSVCQTHNGLDTGFLVASLVQVSSRVHKFIFFTKNVANNI